MKENVLDKIIEYTRLFDCYGALLTAKQSEALSLYFEDDLSYQEIAENLKISKQAVFDKVSKGMKLLEEMEHKVGFIQYQDRLRDILKSYEASENEEVKELIDQILNI